jgi:anti-sigma factor RsiW
MNCKQIESRLIDYLDGNLSAPERESMELHARSCALCAERIQGFSNVFSALDEWKGIEPSASFNRRLEERLEAEPAHAPFWDYLFGRILPSSVALPAGNPLFALALLVVVSLGALVVGYSPSEPRNLAAAAAATTQQTYASASAPGVDDLTLFQDLPVLEDFDVLRNFDVLQELNTTASAEK